MRGVVMPVFLIERRFAEDLEASAEVADRINRINEEEGVRWLYSFLSADKRKTYCLYEAPEAGGLQGRPARRRRGRTERPPAARRIAGRVASRVISRPGQAYGVNSWA
jgi:hypothetical protein